MANRFWVGGTGTWDGTTTTHWAATTGGAGGASVPGTGDNVFFDASSGTGTVTISGGGNINNFDATGYTGTLTGSTLTVNGTILTLGSGMTASGLGVFTQPANGATLTMTSNGKQISSLNVTAPGSGITSLADALSVGGGFNHTRGGFTTNNFAVTAQRFDATSTNTKTLTLGSTIWTATGTATQAWQITATGTTISTNTATITATGSTATIILSTLNFNGTSFSFTGGGSATLNTSGAVVANLTSNGPGALSLTGNVFATGTVTLTGVSATSRLLVSSSVIATVRIIYANAITGSNVDFRDIIVGGAAVWTTGGTGGNLFTANQASVETDTTGFVGQGNASFSRSTTDAFDGSASLLVTSSAAGDYKAGTLTGTSGVPVTPGNTYTVLASYKAVSTPRTAYIQLSWYTAAGAFISTANANSTVTSTTAWTSFEVAAVAPANAAFASAIFVFFSSAAAGEAHYVDKIGFYQNIPAVDLSAIAGGSGDYGDNSGIIFTASTTQYWVGGGGTWNSTSTAKWASTSGGVGGTGHVPLPQDDARFDANSGAGTVTVNNANSGVYARNMDFTGSTLGLSLTNNNGNNVFLSGNLTLGAGMGALAGGASVSLSFWGGTSTLTSNGKSFGTLLVSVGVAGFSLGTVTLGDVANFSQGLQVITGTFNTNNFNMTLNGSNFAFTNTHTINMGTSVVTIPGSFGTVWNPATGGLTNPSTAFATCTLNFTGSGITVATNGMAHGTIQFGAANLTLSSATNTVTNITNTSAGGLILGGNLTLSGVLTMLTTGSTAGSGGSTNWGYTSIVSNSVGTQRTIALGTTGTVAVSNAASGGGGIVFEDIAFTGTATPVTTANTGAANIGDGGGNSGITPSASKTLYLSNNSGQQWDQWSAWALTSGGTPDASSRAPLPQDDVVIDANTAQTFVTASNGGYPFWGRNLTVNKAGFNVNTLIAGGLTHNIYGNLDWQAGNLNSAGTGTLQLKGRGTHTINLHGQTLGISTSTIFQNGPGGTYTFTNGDVIGGQLSAGTGTMQLPVNGTLTCYNFVSAGAGTRTVNFSDSYLKITGFGSNTFNIGTGSNATHNSNANSVVELLDPTLNGKTWNVQTFNGQLKWVNDDLQAGAGYNNIRMYSGSDVTATTSTKTLTLTAAAPAGGTAILVCKANGVRINSITDSKGNTWTIDKVSSNTSGARVSFASAGMTAAYVVGDTITVNLSGNSTMQAGVFQYYGMLTVAPTVDVTSENSAASGTSIASPVTTTSPYDILFSAVGLSTSGTGLITPTGFTTRDTGQSGSIQLAEWTNLNTATTYAATWTWTTSQSSAECTVAYKARPTGGSLTIGADFNKFAGTVYIRGGDKSVYIGGTMNNGADFWDFEGTSARPGWLASTAFGTQRVVKFSPAASNHFRYLNVSDISANTNSQIAYDSIDGGDNVGWTFAVTPAEMVGMIPI